MPVDQAACAGVFRRLGLPLTEQPGVITVSPPSWRFDLQLEEDLIEEVVRVVGYDKLPDAPPLAPLQALRPAETRRSSYALRHGLAGLGYQEVISFSFVEERWERELAGNDNPIRVLNPIASPLAVMRSSLMGSLIGMLRHNLARKADRVCMFEIGRVYARDAAVASGAFSVAGIAQPMRVGGLAYGPVVPAQWGQADRRVDYFDVKGDLEALLSPRRAIFRPAAHAALHPGRSAEVWLGDLRIGVVGELHPRWRQAYDLPHAPVLFELELDALLARDLPAYRPLPRHQPAWRDLAFVVGPSASHDTLIAALLDDPDGLVRRATLFDVYRPASTATAGTPSGEHSMAVRLELLDDQATLTDERIESAVQAARSRAEQRVGARLRT